MDPIPGIYSSHTFAPLPKVYEKEKSCGFMKQIAYKICSVMHRFFMALATLFDCAPKQLPHLPIVVDHTAHAAAVKPLQLVILPDKPPLPVFKNLPPHIQEVRQVVKEIVEDAAAIVNDEVLTPYVEKLPEYVKTAADKMQDVAEVLLAVANTKVVDNLIVFNKPDANLRKFIRFLLELQDKNATEDRQSDYRKKVFDNLISHFAAINTRQSGSPEHKEFEHYCSQMNSWLLNLYYDKDNANTINFAPPPGTKLNEDLQKTIFKACMKKLIQTKVEYISSLINEQLSADNLEKLVLDLVKTNHTQVADYLTGRLGKLIKRSDFPQLFDNVIEAVAETTVAIDAGPGKLQDDLRKIIRMPPAAPGAKPESVDNHRVASFITERFLNVLFDEDHRGGGNQPLHPILVLLANFYWPEELKTIFKGMKELFIEPIEQIEKSVEKFASDKPGILEIVRRFISRVQDPVKELITEVMKEVTRETTTKLIEGQMDSWLKPEKLDDLSGQVILPTLNQQLLRLAMVDVFTENLATWEALYHDHTQNPEQVLSAVVKMIEIRLTHRNFQPYSDLAREDRIKIFTEAFASTHEDIWKLLENVPAKEVKDKILVFFKSETRSEDPNFRTIINNLIYSPNLGNFKFTEGFFFKKMFFNWAIKVPLAKNIAADVLGPACSNGTKAMRETSEEIMKLAANALKNSSLKQKDELKEMLFGDVKPIDGVKAAKQVQDEIKIMGELIYDSILEGGKESVGQKTIRTILGSGENIEKAITNVYGNLTKNPDAIRELILRISNAVMYEFKLVNDQPKKPKPPRPHANRFAVVGAESGGVGLVAQT